MQVIVLGGGISGLSLAWALKRHCDVTVLEKSNQPGGWMQSASHEGFFFEKGPRTFKTSRCQPLLDLVSALGLKDQIIQADESAKVRYLWLDGKLQKLPWPLLNRRALWGLVNEWRAHPKAGDESIWDFGVRRLGVEITERFLDPLTLGIFAGDIRKLSIESCLPFFKRIEEQHGSLTKGLLFGKRKKSSGPQGSLFSFRAGTETLIDALARTVDVQTGVHATGLRFTKAGVEVETNRGIVKGDLLVSSLPPRVLSELFKPLDAEISQLLEIPTQSLKMVQLGYRDAHLKHKGFGYLIPSSQKEQLLGVVFDSMVFPQQNSAPGELRLTAMLRANDYSDEANVQLTLEALERHLGLKAKPTVTLVSDCQDAIPQYEVGHAQRIRKLEAKMKERFGRCHLIGNALWGASVSDCVALSTRKAELIKHLMTMVGHVADVQRK